LHAYNHILVLEDTHLVTITTGSFIYKFWKAPIYVMALNNIACI